jgi:hypothetical protein
MDRSDRQMNRHTDKQPDSKIQMDRKTDWQTDREADRKLIHTRNVPSCLSSALYKIIGIIFFSTQYPHSSLWKSFTSLRATWPRDKRLVFPANVLCMYLVVLSVHRIHRPAIRLTSLSLITGNIHAAKLRITHTYTYTHACVHLHTHTHVRIHKHTHTNS